MAERQFDLTRDTLAVVFLFALIAASVWILLPFLGAVVWATMIVVATWPFLLRLQRWLLGRRWLAVTGMTLLLLAIFILPFSFAIVAVAENFKEITAWTTSLSTLMLPPPPDWLGKIPLVGARMTSNWQQLTALSHEELAARLSPYLGGIVRWLAGRIGDPRGGAGSGGDCPGAGSGWRDRPSDRWGAVCRDIDRVDVYLGDRTSRRGSGAAPCCGVALLDGQRHRGDRAACVDR